MGRNATKKGPKQKSQEDFPKEVYEKQTLSKQICCYQYWIYLETDGTEGWSPTEVPGSVFKYRSNDYIRRNIPQSSFPKIGRVRKRML